MKQKLQQILLFQRRPPACATNNFRRQSKTSPLCDRRRELCNSLFRQTVRDDSHVTHLLLTDCDQQSHFQYSTPIDTRTILVSDILFLPFALINFNRYISILLSVYLCMSVLIVCLIQSLAAKLQ